MQNTFKASARALDMLGRQQIAGRPTAISELFKNAHDAYANNVEVDYYKQDRLFVLRDNGYGMTYEEFVDRWLTIGTESKLGKDAGVEPPYVPPGADPRPILGEKGIGRLAIAAIGPQVLVLTRAKRNTKIHSLVACYIHWGFFEIPGISLEDVQISVREFNNKFPAKADVESMLDEALKNLERLKDHTPKNIYRKISTEIEEFRIDPSEIDTWQDHLSLQGKGSGTHFIISPTLEELDDELKRVPDDTGISEMQKALLGFSNTMTPGHERDPISICFRYHQSDEFWEELIGESEFFLPEEFKKADHHIAGTFDEYGQFRGSVTVYDTTPENHVVPWLEAGGQKTVCGPFKINVAVVQGQARDSLLEPEEHARMIKKLDRIGGLYIYNDNIRVLPYGDSDVDFLEIEKRRTLKASYYYFSYRRIFGIIELFRDKNPYLHEKAGREGFRGNAAYKQFRAILMNFFLRIAAEFFRDTGAKAEPFTEQKEDLNAKEKAKAKRENLVSVNRRRLKEELTAFFNKIEDDRPQSEVADLMDEISAKFERIKRENNLDKMTDIIFAVEKEAHERLRSIESSYRVVKPRGISLYRVQSKEYETYSEEYDELISGTFQPARERLESTIGSLSREAKVQLDLRKRVEATLQDQASMVRKDLKREHDDTRIASRQLHEEVHNLTRESIAEVSETINSVLADIQSTETEDIDETALLKIRDELGNRVLEVFELRRDQLENVRAQLQAVSAVPDEQGRIIGTSEMAEAMEEDLIALQEKADADIELIQIGNAISIVQHEFNQTVQGVRRSLRELTPWADTNRELKPLYTNLRNNFDHLDGYLKLLTPFQRRQRGRPSVIKGTELVKYLKNLFSERMKRHEIILNTAPAFGSAKMTGYLSTIYPAFVNLIDNAIYWLKEVDRKRRILLDYRDGEFIISDTGPGVRRQSRALIFDRGYSMKPGGLGLGLYISRRALLNDPQYKYELLLGELAEGEGAKFIVRPLIEENEDRE